MLQYYVACKGLNVTTTIHTAHAQKHFSPETKSKVRPKIFRSVPVPRGTGNDLLEVLAGSGRRV